MITFENVSYTYPQTTRPVLRHINLSLPEGSLSLIAGPSGAGKSTLLRCINGLVPHFSGGLLEGTILVDRMNPVLVTPQVMSQHVGFVFQDPEAQFVVDHVEDEIAFALENSAMPRQDMRIRVEEVLDLLDLAPLRERPLNTLSGGEKQRVAIASALALRPRVLVLDEPTSQLDPKSAEDVLNALVRLNTDLGLTIVLAEHRMERVLAFVDTIVFVPDHEAKLLVGCPQEVLPQMDLSPPLITLGKALNWTPLPLTIKEGMRLARNEQNRIHKPATSTVQPQPTTMPFLQVRKLEIAYQGKMVVRGIDLDVYTGEIVALMGRNGAGKTTLLKSMVGLVKPHKGKITLSGTSIAGHHIADICRQVGYLPQDPNALLFADTVAEELAITLRNHGISADTTSVPRLLEQLGLQDKAQRYPRDLSTGERQRVALGAITITHPGALLLDEPTRGLDYVAKQKLVELLQQWRSEGTAIVIVTHDVEFAAMVANRVVLMSQGEIIANGKPSDVMGASPLFAPQIARLFPWMGWLTVQDAFHAMGICKTE
jgi:energy-coupling factor transport system ATP-binding protein